MIVVKRMVHAYYWRCSLRRSLRVWNGPYDTADHALRDAWTWVGRGVRALIYTRRP